MIWEYLRDCELIVEEKIEKLYPFTNRCRKIRRLQNVIFKTRRDLNRLNFNMARIVRIFKTLRNNWKKSTVGFLLVSYGVNYGVTKFRYS
jgi:hypothetical protein